EIAMGLICEPLDANSVGRRRAGSYGRFTLSSMVRLLVEYADSEYSLATAESIPRARELYLSALGLLRTHPYAAALDSCQRLIDELLAELAASAGLEGLVAEVGRHLREIDDGVQLNNVIAQIRAVISTEQPVQEKISAIRNLIQPITAPGEDASVEDLNRRESALEQAAHLKILPEIHQKLRNSLAWIEDRADLNRFWNRHRPVPLPQLSFCVPPS